MTISLTYIILLISPIFVLCEERDAPCITPNGENATCIPVQTCAVIQEGLSSLNDSVIQFAQKSQCGYDTGPLICCGSTSYHIYGTNPPESNLLPNRTICGFSIEDDRIYGGNFTEIGEFPWMALLGYKNSDNTSAGFKCGGTLINQRYVLTAAHCVRVSASSGLTLDMVRLGEWQISAAEDCQASAVSQNDCADPVIDLKIEKMIAHRNYSRKSGDNDIGLIRLASNVVYTEYVRPICLPSYTEKIPEVGSELVVAGWGSMENRSVSDYKLKLIVPVVSNSDCLAKIKNRGKISENQLCAGGVKGRDSCQGDSGGPLMGKYEEMIYGTQWYQEGVIAWGIGCGIKDLPAVYTRIAMYLDWILDNMTEF